MDHPAATGTTAEATTMEFASGRMLASVADGVGTITFNQPGKRNAMSVEMWDGLTEILDRWLDDPAVRVVVLTGAGDKAFVSGADISQFERRRGNADAQREYDRLTAAGRARLAAFRKPVIARIRGFCLGGGLGIALAADIRVAAVGAIAFTLIPTSSPSKASVRVKAKSAPFAVTYGVCRGNPIRVGDEVMTTRPEPLATRWGQAAAVTPAVPRTCTSRCHRIEGRTSSPNAWTSLIPALLTTMLSLGWAATTACASASISDGLDTSTLCHVTFAG